MDNHRHKHDSRQYDVYATEPEKMGLDSLGDPIYDIVMNQTVIQAIGEIFHNIEQDDNEHFPYSLTSIKLHATMTGELMLLLCFDKEANTKGMKSKGDKNTNEAENG